MELIKPLAIGVVLTALLIGHIADAEAKRRRTSIARSAVSRSYGATSPRTSAHNSYYANCSVARAAGAAPVRRGDPGYSRRLDRDGDGVGCE